MANIKNEKLRSQHELVLQAPHNHEYAKKISYNMGHKTQDRMWAWAQNHLTSRTSITHDCYLIFIKVMMLSEATKLGAWVTDRISTSENNRTSEIWAVNLGTHLSNRTIFSCRKGSNFPHLKERSHFFPVESIKPWGGTQGRCPRAASGLQGDRWYCGLE